MADPIRMLRMEQKHAMWQHPEQPEIMHDLPRGPAGNSQAQAYGIRDR